MADTENTRTKSLILLVDDDQDNREMYATFLSKRGLDVIEAGDGSSALDTAFARDPDLIVMDLTLPDIDGLEVIHRLRGDSRSKATPVIVVSGYALDSQDIVGPEPWDAFMTKPCPPDKLVDKIKQLARAPSAARS